MNIIEYKVKALPIILALIGFLVSCDNKDDVNSNNTELISFGPSGVVHGEDIDFIGKGLDKVTSVILPPGIEVPQRDFKSQTPELIVLTVPIETTEGKVVLKTPQGDIESKTTFGPSVTIVLTSMPAEAKPGSNITITGEFLNFVKGIIFTKDKLVTEFVSQTRNELVVRVPIDAVTGTIVLSDGKTDPQLVESENKLVLKTPTITSLAPSPVERGGTLTISGQDLDLTAGILFKGVTDPVTSFSVTSATELTVVVPEAANQGVITLVTYSGLTVASQEAMKLAGALPPLAPLGLAFYTDDLDNGWQKWGGWGGGSSDIASTDNVRDGSADIKVIFANDWGGSLQLGGGNSSTTGFSEIAFSIYGEAGTNGLELNVLVAGNQKIITIVEGEWTEYHVPLSDLTSPAVINEFTLQARGWAGTIYIDHIGLR